VDRTGKTQKWLVQKKRPRKTGKDEGIDWTNVKIKGKGGGEGREVKQKQLRERKGEITKTSVKQW
jgi:hypothetical protein